MDIIVTLTIPDPQLLIYTSIFWYAIGLMVLVGVVIRSGLEGNLNTYYLNTHFWKGLGVYVFILPTIWPILLYYTLKEVWNDKY